MSNSLRVDCVGDDAIDRTAGDAFLRRDASVLSIAAGGSALRRYPPTVMYD